MNNPESTGYQIADTRAFGIACGQGKVTLPWERIIKNNDTLGAFAYSMDAIRRHLEIAHKGFDEAKVVLWAGKISIYKEMLVDSYVSQLKGEADMPIEEIQTRIESLFKNMFKDFSYDRCLAEIGYFERAAKEMKFEELPEEVRSNYYSYGMPLFMLTVKVQKLYEFRFADDQQENAEQEIHPEVLHESSACNEEHPSL